jgi:mono/diheme cytochrome c family protein
MQAYERHKKVPFWALPVLVALPLWALFYAGTLEPPKSSAPTLLGEGSTLFAANCASCHGATGGGGVGPELNAGMVLHTFGDPVEQVHWVITGSAGAVAGKYGDTGKQSKGGMPSFGLQKTLTLEQIVAVVRDERENLSGEVLDQAVADKWAGLEKLADDPTLNGLYTKADIDAVLERMATETGLTISTSGS